MTLPTRIALLLLTASGLLALAGCTTVPSWASRWPIVQQERTTYRTPAMRIDAIREFAAQSTGVDSADQRELTDQLARQIQIEPDPLVRQAIVETIAEFRTPLAQQVLAAGLGDSDEAVRIACCRCLGKWGDESSVEVLAGALGQDQDIDVRIAAAEALGNIKSPAAIKALTVALDDRDPAMQYVGVESLKSISGQDFGGDVRAWRQYAAGDSPQIQAQPISIAERIRDVSPF